jgi:nucleoid-associated protein YgaU
MADDDRRTAAGTVAGVAASLTALLLAAPRPSAAVGVLRDAAAVSDPTAPLVAAVALAAWAVSAWLAVTVLLVLLSRLPGQLGRGGRALAARTAPSAVRRAVELTLGLTVAVGVVAPSTALAAPLVPSSGPAVQTSTADRGWDLDWPSTEAAPAPSPAAARQASTAPAPSRAPAADRPAVTPSRPHAPAAAAAPPPAPPAGAPPPAALPAPPRPSAVVVRSGDSLWSLAARSLRAVGTPPTPSRVAVEWPRWWAANRDAVGDDPDLLLPGTVLRPPPGSAAPR